MTKIAPQAPMIEGLIVLREAYRDQMKHHHRQTHAAMLKMKSVEKDIEKLKGKAHEWATTDNPVDAGADAGTDDSEG